jgi:hypothetical protein
MDVCILTARLKPCPDTMRTRDIFVGQPRWSAVGPGRPDLWTGEDVGPQAGAPAPRFCRAPGRRRVGLAEAGTADALERRKERCEGRGRGRHEGRCAGRGSRAPVTFVDYCWNASVRTRPVLGGNSKPSSAAAVGATSATRPASRLLQVATLAPYSTNEARMLGFAGS